jgi:hypothetical protein
MATLPVPEHPLPAADVPGPLRLLAATPLRPAVTFARLVQRPTWWLPFLIGLVLAAVFGGLLAARADLPRTVREEWRAAGGEPEASEAQLQAVVAAYERTRPLFPVIGALKFGFWFFLGAGLLQVALAACGTEANTAQVLALYAHARLPQLLWSALTVGVLLGTPMAPPTVAEARRLVAWDLSSLAPGDAGPALLALGQACDVFSIAGLALLVVGLHQLPDLSPRAARGVPVALFALGVLAQVAWAGWLG